MPQTANNQPATSIRKEVNEFLIDRQSRNLTPKTLAWYTHALDIFVTYAERRDIASTGVVSASTLRHFLVWLANEHNAGGVRNIFGAVRAFIHWYGVEIADADWQNPLPRVRQPRRPDTIEPPLELADFQAMVDACEVRTLIGDRDRALLLLLLDSGLRHAECTDLRVGDVDLNTGQVMVRSGKGRKTRIAFVGSKTRRVLASYLRRRGDPAPDTPLWMTRNGDAMSKGGIREIIRRRARQAGIDEPGLHEFRRAFAINYLRNGGDMLTLQRLLGHSDLTIIQRYVKLLDADLQAAHKNASPVDALLK